MCAGFIWDGEKLLALVVMVNERWSLTQSNVLCTWTTCLFWRALIRGCNGVSDYRARFAYLCIYR